jgi:hypothetical protein
MPYFNTNRALQHALKWTGELCTAVIQNAPTTFYGVLDHKREYTGDNYGRDVPVDMITLTLTSEIANQLTVGQTITIGSTNYQLRDRLAMDDGVLSVCDVAKVPS